MCDREACNEGAYSNLLEQAEAAIQRIRDLHKPDKGKNIAKVEDADKRDLWYAECLECWSKYPCATIRALDGEQE